MKYALMKWTGMIHLLILNEQEHVYESVATFEDHMIALKICEALNIFDRAKDKGTQMGKRHV